MKRLAALVLLFIYFAPASGIGISVHYCGGKFASASLGWDETKKCGCGSKKMNKKCCEDKKFSLEQKNNLHEAPQISSLLFKTFDFQPLLVSDCALFFQTLLAAKWLHKIHLPPLKFRQSLNILHQVFRI